MESVYDKYREQISGTPDFLKPFVTGIKRNPNQVSSTHVMRDGKMIPMTHADSMPAGVHAATTSALGEIDARQGLRLNEGQREAMARHMVHGVEPTEQTLVDYRIPVEVEGKYDGVDRPVSMPGEYLFNPRVMAEMGRQGLAESGFEGWKDNDVSDIRVNAGPYSYAQSNQHQYMPISGNNQKYYAHMRAPNLLAGLTGDGPKLMSLRDLHHSPTSEENQTDAAAVYNRAKENPRFGYTGMFSGPNYAEAPVAALANNETLIGAAENALDFGGSINDYITRKGMEARPVSGNGGGSLGLTGDALASWGQGLLAGQAPDAVQYADSLAKTKNAGLGMNPQLPGDTYEERMGNRELAASRAQLGEVEDMRTLAKLRGHGNISGIGESLMAAGRGVAADPSILFTAGGIASPVAKAGIRGARAAAGELAKELAGESVWSSPDIAAALMGGSALGENLLQEEADKLAAYRSQSRQAMMNPRQSPWLN